MNTYNEKHLVLLDWPRAQRTADGRWMRVWELHFLETIKPHLSISTLATACSEEDFAVSLTQHGPQDITATVMTSERHGESDEVVFANHAFLKQLNDSLGTIATIQGQARELWLPWRQHA